MKNNKLINIVTTIKIVVISCCLCVHLSAAQTPKPLTQHSCELTLEACDTALQLTKVQLDRHVQYRALTDNQIVQLNEALEYEKKQRNGWLHTPSLTIPLGMILGILVTVKLRK